jgi:hypothetical protein
MVRLGIITLTQAEIQSLDLSKTERCASAAMLLGFWSDAFWRAHRDETNVGSGLSAMLDEQATDQ